MDQAPKSREHVNSLAKGLAVLAATNELAPARISSLVKATALPKATLVRLLKTLVAEGYVNQQTKREGGAYLPSPKVRELASSYAKAGALGQTAQSFLNNLGETVKWPTDLLVRDGLSMLIEASNRDGAPLRLQRFEQARFSLLSSSAGQAFLAWQPAAKRQELIGASLELNEIDNNNPIGRHAIEESLQETRHRGFAFHSYDTPIEGTRVFSVPLLHQGTSLAVMTLISLRDVLSLEDFSRNIFPHMKTTAGKITAEFARFS